MKELVSVSVEPATLYPLVLNVSVLIVVGPASVTVPAVPENTAFATAECAPFVAVAVSLFIPVRYHWADAEFQVPDPPNPAPVVVSLPVVVLSLSQYSRPAAGTPTNGEPSLNLNKSAVPPSSVTLSTYWPLGSRVSGTTSTVPVSRLNR